MPDSFPYDVFLSHILADKLRVRWLAECLQAAGRRQDCFGFRMSDFGFPPQAVRVGLERSTGLFRDPANAGRRFIPQRQTTQFLCADVQAAQLPTSWN
jgi:hypothetical protein